MDYQYFTVNDFADDVGFRNYVLRKNTTDIAFWTQWLNENPNKKETIAEAWDNVNSVWKTNFKEEWTYYPGTNEWTSYNILYWQGGQWNVGYNNCCRHRIFY